MRAAIASIGLTIAFTGCTGTGKLDLDLQLPSAPDLKPSGMTSITVLATSPDIPPIANTSPIGADGSFTAGELPVADNVEIGVLLRNDSNRLVGLGQASDKIDISGSETTQLSIPVRKPFIYAANGANLYSYDATLDPRDPKFQGQLGGVQSPQFMVSLGGDRLVVAGTSALQVVETATHKVKGNPIALGGVTVNDLAPVPGTHKVAVAHSGGITIVDIDSGQATAAMVGAVDRVTAGPGGEGKLYAYGLVGRVTPSENPLVNCSGSSMLVAVSVDAPATVAPRPLGDAVSDIAVTTDPSAPKLYATLPCTGQVAQVMGDPAAEVAQLKLMKVSDLPNAAVLTVAADRVIAAGSQPSVPYCENAAQTTQVDCTPTAPMSCPEQNTVHVAFATTGARLVLQSIPLEGGAPIVLAAPERRETMVDSSDPALQHTEVMHAYYSTPLDLVVLPGSQYVSVVTKSRYYIEHLETSINFQTVILIPCLDATTYDWQLFDLASASVAQRIRTQCDLVQKPDTNNCCFFGPFQCDAPPAGESSTLGQYKPTSVGALFGAR